MALSSLSAFSFIEEGSRATPGLWNAPFSVISQNIAQINSDGSVDAESISALSTSLSEVSTVASDSSTAASEISTRLVGYDAGSVATDLTIDAANLLIASGGTIRSAVSHTPSGTSTGVAGDIMWDDTYIYICTSLDSWSRATLLPF